MHLQCELNARLDIESQASRLSEQLATAVEQHVHGQAEARLAEAIDYAVKVEAAAIQATRNVQVSAAQGAAALQQWHTESTSATSAAHQVQLAHMEEQSQQLPSQLLES